MEHDLTKRRPSIIPGTLPLLGSWTPTIPSLEEEECSAGGTLLSYLPPISSYDTKPVLTIKKFSSPTIAQTSIAHTYGICLLDTDDEQLIVCDHYNNRLIMFNSNDGSLIDIFRQISVPESVCIRPNHPQQIYVTKAHSLNLYDIEKKQIIQKLGSEESGHANNRFNLPCGIVVDPGNGEIYMCDSWNHRICVFSPDFRYVNRRWYLHRWEQPTFKVKPNFIAINEKQECAVTCDDAPIYRGAVYVFDKMGYIKKIYDHETKKPGPCQLNVPQGILLDNNGTWLTVCYSDQDARCVERTVIVNDDEDQQQQDEKITYFRSKELKGGCGLAIKRDQTIIIGDRDDNKILFFKQKADNVTK
ncbi:unnamed protein product [Didymodactylos carnosus]|uniref:Uncharacterized protein n=1 Tax=Didymodactylos carnosus TaxID=1234261 RepID=A0A815K3U0_9BILA|nr:unnamed protein product [Didymodactylos carnosus]CAF1426537.1 unnamed protein product [Didymodactylos carnosus]CAF4225582.1 unnamed protein product [Didymodactylos carnosus]CAF4279975.1 unnamed protein product [Didymodactylos carnosus]